MSTYIERPRHSVCFCASRWSWSSVPTWRMSSTTKRWRHLNIQSRYNRAKGGEKKGAHLEGVMRHRENGSDEMTRWSLLLLALLRFYPSSSGGVPRAMSCHPSFGNRWSTRCLLNAERRCPGARYTVRNRSIYCHIHTHTHWQGNLWPLHGLPSTRYLFSNWV